MSQVSHSNLGYTDTYCPGPLHLVAQRPRDLGQPLDVPHRDERLQQRRQAAGEPCRQPRRAPVLRPGEQVAKGGVGDYVVKEWGVAVKAWSVAVKERSVALNERNV